MQVEKNTKIHTKYKQMVFPKIKSDSYSLFRNQRFILNEMAKHKPLISKKS